jgi:predicted AlkP superfamily phosphohydrolase/phosphomutase
MSASLYGAYLAATPLPHALTDMPVPAVGNLGCALAALPLLAATGRASWPGLAPLEPSSIIWSQTMAYLAQGGHCRWYLTTSAPANRAPVGKAEADQKIASTLDQRIGEARDDARNQS